MSQKAKSPVVILVVLIIISLVFAGGIFFLFQKEHLKNLSLQDELNEVKTRQKITEVKLEEYKRLLSALESKLKETRTQLEVLTNDLSQEKSAKEEALLQISQLRADLEQQKKLRSELENKLSGAQNEMRNTQSQLKELEAKKNELETRIGELQAKSDDLETKIQSVELGKIVVSRDKVETKKAKKAAATSVAETAAPLMSTAVTAIASKSLEGKVLVVNKDYNFVVINLGSKDGVTIGSTFSVHHNDKYIGDIKISKLHDSMAAADFVAENIKDTISEGDKVILKVS